MKLINTYRIKPQNQKPEYYLSVLFKKIPITGKEYSMLNNVLNRFYNKEKEN